MMESQIYYQLALSYINEGKVKQASTELDKNINNLDISMELQYKSYIQKLHLSSDKNEQSNLSAIIIDKFHSTEFAAQAISDIAHFHELTGDHDRHMGALEHLELNHPDHEREWVIFSMAKGLQYFTKDIAKATIYYIRYLNEFGNLGQFTSVVAINLADCYNALNQPQEARKILKKYIVR
jgi:predicted Zn-dependent protease